MNGLLLLVLTIYCDDYTSDTDEQHNDDDDAEDNDTSYLPIHIKQSFKQHHTLFCRLFLIQYQNNNNENSDTAETKHFGDQNTASR